MTTEFVTVVVRHTAIVVVDVVINGDVGSVRGSAVATSGTEVTVDDSLRFAETPH